MCVLSTNLTDDEILWAVPKATYITFRRNPVETLPSLSHSSLPLFTNARNRALERLYTFLVVSHKFVVIAPRV